MNEYEAIAVYAIFALLVFAVAMLWQRYRITIKKRIRLVNYHSDHERHSDHKGESQKSMKMSQKIHVG